MKIEAIVNDKTRFQDGLADIRISEESGRWRSVIARQRNADRLQRNVFVTGAWSEVALDITRQVSPHREVRLSARRLSMRRIKEVLRLKYELGLGQRQIARSCSIGQSTVHDYLRRAEVAGLRWPLTEEWDDDRIERELFGRAEQPSTPAPPRPLPDFASIHDQLRQHRHLTLQLLWVEYRQAHPDGYGYSPLLRPLSEVAAEDCCRANRIQVYGS